MNEPYDPYGSQWQGGGPPYRRNVGEVPFDGSAGWAKNPDGTYPFPAPERIGTPGWFGARTPLFPWVVAPVAQTVASDAVLTIFWDSPLFDLRPEFRGIANSSSTFSAGGALGSVPIWRGGVGGKLYIQVYRLNETADALTDIVLNAIEFGDVGNPVDVQQIIPPSDVTDQLVGPGQPSTILIFEPPGAGAPQRFWRVRLVFDRLSNIQNTYDIKAAYY